MTTKAVAIVPVKHLATVKSRLAGRMTLPERRELVLNLLRHSLAVLAESESISRVFVITPDDAVSREARCHGVDVLWQEDEGINPAIRLGLDAACADDEQVCLISLADLPLLTVADVDAMVEQAGPRTLVIAPDRHGQGTNALVTDLSDGFEPEFGGGSLAAHRRQAARRRWDVREHHSVGTALDLDTPDDLDEYAQRVGLT